MLTLGSQLDFKDAVMHGINADMGVPGISVRVESENADGVTSIQ